MIGLTGPHRTGKTTLAEIFTQETGIEFVRTSTSQVFKDLGLDPQAEYPLEVRMTIQEQILQTLSRQYASAQSGVFIADRTPIDMMAYTLADITRAPLTDAMEERVQKYMDDCFKATNRFFAMIVVVQPGIPLVSDPTKAPIGNAYIEHFANLAFGLSVSESIAAAHYYIPRRMTDLGDRVRCVKAAFDKLLDKNAKLMGLDYEGDELLLH